MPGTVERSGCGRSGALRLDGTVRGICGKGLTTCEGAPDNRGGWHGAGSGQCGRREAPRKEVQGSCGV
jgi:hypothetical protein